MSTKKGLQLERRIVSLLHQQQKIGVQHDVTTKHKIKQFEFRNQFDVLYGFRETHYLECKNYRTNRTVPFEQAASFVCKLILENANFNQGTIITTADYDQRTYALASKIGLTLVNGEDLKKLEKEPKKILGRLFDGYHQLMNLVKK